MTSVNPPESMDIQKEILRKKRKQRIRFILTTTILVCGGLLVLGIVVGSILDLSAFSQIDKFYSDTIHHFTTLLFTSCVGLLCVILGLERLIDFDNFEETLEKQKHTLKEQNEHFIKSQSAITEVIKRLDKIDGNLNEPQPPSYEDFNAALPEIKKILADKLNHDKEVNIKILGVSAQFSWQVLIVSTIPKLLRECGNSPRINIEVVIVKPSLLHDWAQLKLENDSQNTLLGEHDFRRKYKTDFLSGKLKLAIYQYDNIPHWHGILIDNDTLFMGRCKWDVIDRHYHLQVGQIDYRQFRKDDKFGGNARIELVDNWFDAYKFRANYLLRNESSKRNSQPPKIKMEISEGNIVKDSTSEK